MKISYFLVFLFVSCKAYSSSQSIQSDALKLVTDVQNFLNQFQVQRLYKESREEFLKRLKESKEFTNITYAICPAIIVQDHKIVEIDKKKKKHLLGLFVDDSYVVKQCGFWEGSEEGFYVAPATTVVGNGLARFKEKGKYEWIINFPNTITGDDFTNDSIQSLINYLKDQPDPTIIVPLETRVSVMLTKDATSITARLQYT